MGGLAAPAHDPDGRHKVVRPLFDDAVMSGMSCPIPYDTSCHSLHVSYLLLAGRDAMFAIRGRWGNGRDRLSDCS